MIYFVRLGSGAIKIGYTEFLDQRLVSLRSTYCGKAELLHAMEGDMDVEGGLHDRFAHLQLGRSEQFRPGLDLLEFIGRSDLAAADPGAVVAQEKREGLRQVVHLSLGPEAVEVLKALCDRPIAPISISAMVEHIIMQAAPPGR